MMQRYFMAYWQIGNDTPILAEPCKTAKAAWRLGNRMRRLGAIYIKVSRINREHATNAILCEVFSQ